MTREQKEIGFAWAALAAATTAWFGSQQFGSNLSFRYCHASGPLAGIIIGLLALALAAIGGLYSYRVWDRERADSAGTPFAAMLGMLVAVLLAIAIIYQTIAAFIIPSCFG